MPNTAPNVFLDTNVLVDYHLGRQPQGGACTELIGLLWKLGTTPYIAAVSLKDLFYLVSAHIKQSVRKEKGALIQVDTRIASKIAWACVEQTLDIAEIVPLRRPECLRARDLRALHDDFEDDLVLAAAEHSGADYFVTSDDALRKHASIACLSPSDMVTLLKSKTR